MQSPSELLHKQWIAPQERSIGLGATPKRAEASLLHRGRVLPHPSKLLAANTALRCGPNRAVRVWRSWHAHEKCAEKLRAQGRLLLRPPSFSFLPFLPFSLGPGGSSGNSENLLRECESLGGKCLLFTGNFLPSRGVSGLLLREVAVSRRS